MDPFSIVSVISLVEYLNKHIGHVHSISSRLPNGEEIMRSLEGAMESIKASKRTPRIPNYENTASRVHERKLELETGNMEIQEHHRSEMQAPHIANTPKVHKYNDSAVAQDCAQGGRWRNDVPVGIAELGMYWIQGEPETGKSTLLNAFMEHALAHFREVYFPRSLDDGRMITVSQSYGESETEEHLQGRSTPSTALILQL